MTRQTIKMNDEDAAYCAVAWYSGASQGELARIYGYANQSPISHAIARFVDWYYPSQIAGGHYPSQSRFISDDVRFSAYGCRYGENKKQFVPDALTAFIRLRDRALGFNPFAGQPGVNHRAHITDVALKET